jgi:ABC-type glycerol-3-phosphate transport system substrate-binding protein
MIVDSMIRRKDAMKISFRWWLIVLALAATAASVVATASATGRSSASGSLTVWVDSVRLPVAKLYAKTHPKVHLHIVTFDGDSNGATTLQAKIQLWNRTGKGWPDIIFSEQVNDPVWMASKPFDYAANLGNNVFPTKLLKSWPSPSLAQCRVNGQLVCVQDNLAQEVLYYNKKLMAQFGYQVPTTWQQWAHIGADVAKNHPGYIIGTVGDSYGHWLYLWADRCPLSTLKGPNTVLINASDSHCTRMANLLDPLIANKSVSDVTVFSPDFAKAYGGSADKVLMMPGPTWYALSLFRDTLKLPAGEWTASAPLRWGSEPIVTGQVGGGPWIVSRHTKNMAAALNFVEWATTASKTNTKEPGYAAVSPGYPSYGPGATAWLKSLNRDPFFAAPPGPAMQKAANAIWKGWGLVTYPDQPVWSNSVVTGLVAGKSLSSLLPALGQGLSQAAQAAGYKVVSH